jgi:hypothetical protein
VRFGIVQCGEKGLDDLIVAQGPRQAQADAIESEAIKSQHYQALYRALARSVGKQKPGLVGVVLDAAVYRLAMQRGEVADGVRVICYSPFALKLADPELVRAYVAEVQMRGQVAVGRGVGWEH